MKIRNFLFAILGVGLLAFSAFAQVEVKPTSTPTGFGAAEPELLENEQKFVVSFHRPKLDGQGKLTRIEGTDTVNVSEALSPDEIKKGFKVGDRVVIRIKAPVDGFVYVVNNSEKDGSFLTNKGTPLKKDSEQDFIYRLTNSDGKAGTGLEQLMFLIRKTALSDADLNNYLTQGSTGTLTKIKLGGSPEVIKDIFKDLKDKSKTRVIVTLGCRTASMFFPFIGGLCKATGFGAAEPEPLPGGKLTAVSPQNDAENMVVQFSFPVTP